MKRFFICFYSLFPSFRLTLQKKMKWIPVVNVFASGVSLMKLKIGDDDFFRWYMKHSGHMFVILLPWVLLFIFADLFIPILWLRYAFMILFLYIITVVLSYGCIKCQEKIKNSEK